MTKKSNKATTNDYVIPSSIPLEALSRFVFEHDELNADEIISYVEGQSPDETVKHAEKVMTENVLGLKYECWDVWTNKARLWVITPSKNLYDQKLFPSLDYTPSFHLGLVARLMARQNEPNTGALEQMTLPVAWRRWERQDRH
jgi:hypothetical protein